MKTINIKLSEKNLGNHFKATFYDLTINFANIDCTHVNKAKQ